jgi:hypothetical protein
VSQEIFPAKLAVVLDEYLGRTLDDHCAKRLLNAFREETDAVRQSEREAIAFFLGTTVMFTNLCVFPLALRDALGDAIRRGLHERAAR